MTQTRNRKKRTAETTDLPLRPDGSVDTAAIRHGEHRVGEVGRDPVAGARARGDEPRDHKATLVRGVSHTLSYQDCAVHLRRGVPVAVTRAEAERLYELRDGVVFVDPQRGRIERRLPRFRITGADGEDWEAGFEEVELGDAVETDPYAAAQAAKDRAEAGL